MQHCRAVEPGCRSSRKSCCGSHKPGADQSAAEPLIQTAAKRREKQASLLEESLRQHGDWCPSVDVSLYLQKQLQKIYQTIKGALKKQKQTNVKNYSNILV